MVRVTGAEAEPLGAPSMKNMGLDLCLGSKVMVVEVKGVPYRNRQIGYF